LFIKITAKKAGSKVIIKIPNVTPSINPIDSIPPNIFV
tara:strand:- start:529 stop:642 length:114 start_codon:yes stop_codon:yes gene_type:complete